MKFYLLFLLIPYLTPLTNHQTTTTVSPETVEKIKEKQFVEESQKRISALTLYILDNKDDQDTIFFTKRITEKFTYYHEVSETPIAKELFADFMSIEFDQEEITLGDLCTAMLEKLEKYNTAYLVSHYKANKAFYKDKNTKVHFLNEIRTSFTCISCISSTKQSREIKAQNAEIIAKIDALTQQFQNLEKNNAAMLQAFEAQLKTFNTQLKQNEEQIKANNQLKKDFEKILKDSEPKINTLLPKELDK